MGKFFKKPWVIVGFIVIIAAGAGVFYYLRPENNFPPAVKAVYGAVALDVGVTGKTSPVDEVHLSFEKSGRVSRVAVRVGSRVEPGETLVYLEQSELSAQLKQDEASRDGQAAKLDSLKRGSRPEEIDVKKSELAKADQDLANDYEGSIDVLKSGYTTAVDSIRNKTDAMFADDEANPQLSFSLSDSQMETDLEFSRASVGGNLNKWREEIDVIGIVSLPSAIEAAIRAGQSNLSAAANFLNKGLTAMTKTTNLTVATVDSYKANLTAALQNADTALANLNDKSRDISAHRAGREKIKKELDLLLAGSNPLDIKNQEAQVAQAEAKVAATRAQLEKTFLRSPISGTVTEQDFKVGEIAPANTALLSIISESRLQIEANVPEVDIGKIKNENAVRASFDAFPNEEFSGRVFFVDPAETVVEEVVNYKIKISFEKFDPRMKSGLTANLKIETAKKENALIVPQAAVFQNSGGAFVRKIEGDAIKDVPVKTGIRGSDGNVEIISGLKEGDEVAIAR